MADELLLVAGAPWEAPFFVLPDAPVDVDGFLSNALSRQIAYFYRISRDCPVFVKIRNLERGKARSAARRKARSAVRRETKREARPGANET